MARTVTGGTGKLFQLICSCVDGTDKLFLRGAKFVTGKKTPDRFLSKPPIVFALTPLDSKKLPEHSEWDIVDFRCVEDYTVGIPCLGVVLSRDGIEKGSKHVRFVTITEYNSKNCVFAEEFDVTVGSSFLGRGNRAPGVRTDLVDGPVVVVHVAGHAEGGGAGSQQVLAISATGVESNLNAAADRGEFPVYASDGAPSDSWKGHEYCLPDVESFRLVETAASSRLAPISIFVLDGEFCVGILSQRSELDADAAPYLFPPKYAKDTTCLCYNLSGYGGNGSFVGPSGNPLFSAVNNFEVFACVESRDGFEEGIEAVPEGGTAFYLMRIHQGIASSSVKLSGNACNLCTFQGYSPDVIVAAHIDTKRDCVLFQTSCEQSTLSLVLLESYENATGFAADDYLCDGGEQLVIFRDDMDLPLVSLARRMSLSSSGTAIVQSPKANPGKPGSKKRKKKGAKQRASKEAGNGTGRAAQQAGASGKDAAANRLKNEHFQRITKALNERQKSYEKSMAAAKATFDDQTLKVKQFKRIISERNSKGAKAGSAKDAVNVSCTDLCHSFTPGCIILTCTFSVSGDYDPKATVYSPSVFVVPDDSKGNPKNDAGRVETRLSTSRVQRNDDNASIKIKTEVYVSGAEHFVAIACWEVRHRGEEPRNHFREIKRFDLSMCRRPNFLSVTHEETGEQSASLLEAPFLARYLILANDETLRKHPDANRGIHLRLSKLANESAHWSSSDRSPKDARLAAVEQDLRALLQGKGPYSHGVLESCVDGVTWSTQHGRNTLGMLRTIEDILPDGWKLAPNLPCPLKLRIMDDFIKSMIKSLEMLGGDGSESAPGSTPASRKELAAAFSAVELNAYRFFESYEL